MVAQTLLCLHNFKHNSLVSQLESGTILNNYKALTAMRSAIYIIPLKSRDTMIEQSDMLIEQVKAKHTVTVQDSSVDTSIRKNYSQ